MITVYTVSFNEEMFIQFMIDHYRSRFPGCQIVCYDNMSTDKTVEILKANNCHVIPYDTNNQIDDNHYLQIKNNCWKSSTTDWVLVCDVDELLDINESQLNAEDAKGTTIIRSEAYNMVNMEDNFDLPNIKHGARCEPYDKYYLFKKSELSEISYTHGCHGASPKGRANYSDKLYLLYHYKCVNPDYMVERYKLFNSRLSEANKRYKWGNHYGSPSEEVRNSFLLARTYVTKIKD